MNGQATDFARELARGHERVIIEGVVGPRGDGYVIEVEMTVEEAADYHATQVASLAAAGVDQVTAVTVTYTAEAVGFLRAAGSVGIPALVSFTVETDGRLPSGQELAVAIGQVDAETDGAAIGFMINCAHPTHFTDSLVAGEWLGRVVGVRANASTMSHAELDSAEELDEGDPIDLAQRYRELLDRLPSLQVLGGCCGTDHRHVRAIAELCLVG